jgi:glycosyltransferase involved in cell wall biosynthesis
MIRERINVLQFICPTGFYGAERWILALANNSDPQRVRCDLAVTDEAGSRQNLEIVHQYPTGDGQAFRIPARGRFDVSVVGELCRLIRARNIQVIHTHGYKSDILGLLAARRSGIACISTPHGFGEPSSFKLKVFIRLGAFCLRFFDLVAPLSEQLYDECVHFGVPTKKLQYIRNGVDLKEVEAQRQKALADAQPRSINDEKIIGFIGQMIPRKKVDHILDIFDRLARRHQNIRLELLGDGESRAALEEHANTLSSRSRIAFLGFRNDRLERLSRMDLFVMTSSDEGIPRCLMEAMGMGTPIVTYDIPGIDVLIEHNKTGLLARFGDQQTLEKLWEEALFQPDTAQRLSHAAHEFIHREFSGESMARKYADVFERLVHGSTGSGSV